MIRTNPMACVPSGPAVDPELARLAREAERSLAALLALRDRRGRRRLDFGTWQAANDALSRARSAFYDALAPRGLCGVVLDGRIVVDLSLIDEHETRIAGLDGRSS